MNVTFKHKYKILGLATIVFMAMVGFVSAAIPVIVQQVAHGDSFSNSGQSQATQTINSNVRIYLDCWSIIFWTHCGS